MIAFGISLHALAAPPNPFTVQQVDPSFPVEHFKQQDVVVHTHETLTNKRASKTTLPSKAEMSEWLTQSGLTSATSKWDAVERSTLYVRAMKLDSKELLARYPALPKKGLTRFQKLVHEALKEDEDGE